MYSRKQPPENGSEIDDLESRSLSQHEKKEGIRQIYRTRQLIAFLVLTLGAIVMIYREEIASIFLTKKNRTVDVKVLKRVSVATLNTLLMGPMDDYEKMMKEEYGDYRHDSFKKNAIQKQMVSPSPISVERLKRRMKIKIVKAALSPQEVLAEDPVGFTWAVGGHSAAAAHGNLFNQSYAYVLERVAQPVFAALGIEFRGKNYAMGGTSSAPEVAMCMNEIFGMDLDVLSWDYGMTDGRSHPYLYQMYANRAGVHATRPSIVEFGGHGFRPLNRDLESAGMAVFTLIPDMDVIPDSTVVDPMDLPLALRNFMCGGHENGLPCKENKWKTEACGGPIKGQASWHTGWKYHQFIGHLLARFLIENLVEALNELDSSSVVESDSIANENEDTNRTMAPSISESYLSYLLSLEAQDKDTFLASPVPRNYQKIINTAGDEINTILHRNYAVCQTAILPSQARYDGLITESGQVSKYLNGGRTTYIDEGYDYEHLPPPRSEDEPNPVWLSFDQKSRKVCKYADIDFKDFFIVRPQDNLMSMRIPNDAQMKLLGSGDNQRPTLGVVMICTSFFDWSRYPDHYLWINNLTDTSGRGSIAVNDVNVTGSIITDPQNGSRRCHILKHEEGDYFPRSSSGQYEIKIQISGGQLYISSVIVL